MPHCNQPTHKTTMYFIPRQLKSMTCVKVLMGIVCTCAVTMMFATSYQASYQASVEMHARKKNENKNRGAPKNYYFRRRFTDHHAHMDNTTVADGLTRRIRVLCWVLTCPKNLHTRAVHIQNTWGKRCTKILYMSTKSDKDLPVIKLNENVEGRDKLSNKTQAALTYLSRHHLQDADWFIKVDDDTYVIMENLRHFLSDKHPDDLVYYGLHFKRKIRKGYASGGAGYVLSRAALQRYGDQSDEQCGDIFHVAEDTWTGHCMGALGVRLGDTRDAFGRNRFHCFKPRTYISQENFPHWYPMYARFSAETEALSDYAISFHYVKPSDMYTMEFYIYHLRPYGIVSHDQEINAAPANDTVSAH